MTQDEAFTLLTMGKHVFLTGPPGSGKTFLLQRYITWLREHDIEPAITASTGIAATHIGGQTIHSWSGIGIKKKLTRYDLDLLSQNERVVVRMQRTRVLIIDEISMLSAQTFNMIDMAIRSCLQTSEPFGGMQVVLSGDFFQLPPVERENEVTFPFQSASWKHLSPYSCYLEEQHRQNSTPLEDILNAIRNRTVLHEHLSMLATRVTDAPPPQIPHLYTHNVDVDELNEEKLAMLKGKHHTFKMHTQGNKRYVEPLIKGVLAPETLILKKGATVMCVKNHPSGKYVNGTLGEVIGFTRGLPKIRTKDGNTITIEPETWAMEEQGKIKAQLTQLPLRLAWAITIHKSQGMTLDAAFIDLRKTFVEGQGYVALSRIRDLSGLYLKGVHARAFALHPNIAEFDPVLQKESKAVVNKLRCTGAERILQLQKEFLEQIPS